MLILRGFVASVGLSDYLISKAEQLAEACRKSLEPYKPNDISPGTACGRRQAIRSDGQSLALVLFPLLLLDDQRAVGTIRSWFCWAVLPAGGITEGLKRGLPGMTPSERPAPSSAPHVLQSVRCRLPLHW